MSRSDVRAALEIALAAISPPLETAYENVDFTVPAPDTPYQEAYLMAGDPENLEISSDYTEQGYLQINLQYPLNAGAGTAEARAELLRTTFPRGRSLTAGGIITTIINTPSIGPGRVEADRYMIPVKVPYRAQVRS